MVAISKILAATATGTGIITSTNTRAAQTHGPSAVTYIPHGHYFHGSAVPSDWLTPAGVPKPSNSPNDRKNRHGPYRFPVSKCTDKTTAAPAATAPIKIGQANDLSKEFTESINKLEKTTDFFFDAARGLGPVIAILDDGRGFMREPTLPPLKKHPKPTSSPSAAPSASA